MDAPVALWKFPQLHGVIADRRQTVAARLPGQQHLASLHLLLGDGWAASGLRAGCVDWRVVIEWRMEMEQEGQVWKEKSVFGKYILSGMNKIKMETNNPQQFVSCVVTSDTHTYACTHAYKTFFLSCLLDQKEKQDT